jgi:hypothetical protein
MRILALCLAAAAALPAAAIPEPPGATARIRPSGAEEAAFVLSAEGVHVFECKPATGGYTWAFVAPDVTLYDAGRSVATQTVPNQWESSSDRSSVSAILRSTQAAGGDALPWALLKAVPLSESGMFAGVTSIQRVNTSGGVAPASGCGESSAGAEVRVPFTADYYFYRRRTAG